MLAVVITVCMAAEVFAMVCITFVMNHSWNKYEKGDLKCIISLRFLCLCVGSPHELLTGCLLLSDHGGSASFLDVDDPEASTVK